MKQAVILLGILGLICGRIGPPVLPAVFAQEPQSPQSKPGAQSAPAPAAQPANELANELAQRLSQQLRAKTVVGDPVKAGSVTLIPILMVDVNFAGGAKPAKAQEQAIEGYLMNGEARPLGFVAVTSKGTRFIPVGSTPSK